MGAKNKDGMDEIGLAKARYEYCLKLYEREQSRRENIERKAQFYLSFLTIFMGALLFRLEIFTEIREILEAGAFHPGLVTCVYAGAVWFTVSILIALFCVLQTIKARGYNPEYPVNPSLALFSPNGNYLSEYTEAGFFRSAAMTYASALESDSAINNKKSRWLVLTSYSLLSAISAFALFFGSIAYLQFVR